MSDNKEENAQNTPVLIAHVVYYFGTGGMENGVVNLINQLSEEKYRHIIICLTGHTDFTNRINRSDIEFISLNMKEGKDFFSYFRLWQVLRKYKPDIVHTRNLAALVGQVPAFFAGIKYRIHGEHGRDVFDLHGKHKKYNLYRKILSRFVKQYITVSQDLENWLQDELLIHSDRIMHIYNGVDTERFHPLEDRIGHGSLPFDDNAIVLGTVGRMAAVKDQMTLLESFVAMLTERPEWRENLRLVIVGDGDLRKGIETYIKEQSLEDLVWLAGDRNDVPDILPNLDIFVLPSLGEGISNTLLEAMSCGLPVVATNVGGNSELVDDGKTGFLVPSGQPEKLAEALNVLVKNTSLKRLMGQAGRCRVEQEFSLEKMVQGYEGVYSGLVD